MEEKNQEASEVLETGTYEMLSPAGQISIDTLILHGDNGSKRIWKLKEISEKQLIFDIKKFG